MNVKKHLNFTALRRKLSEVFSRREDTRQGTKVQISLHDAVLSGFACMYFQSPSLLQFQKRMQEEQHRNNLATLFEVKKIPKETQLRDLLDEEPSDQFREVFKDYFLRLQRSKALEPFQLFKNIYYHPIDGSQFYSSSEIHCEKCLTKEHGSGKITYSHQVLQGGIAHPDCRQVIPFMPEVIENTDGNRKQDCEMNAAKRYLHRLRKEHPQLGLLIGGDSLFSNQPIIEETLSLRMHYLFALKPDNHTYLMDWLNAYPKLEQVEFFDEKGRCHVYEWMNDVPLNGRKDAVKVNFLRCRMIKKNKRGEEEVAYKNSWVTDLTISRETIHRFVKAGRCRWKNENEIFNVMKNHGYEMEHNYGHGKKHLAFNFYLLTLLAFFFHQIFELTDPAYQDCRKKFGSKQHLWEKFRAYVDLLIFETWESFLAFMLRPKKGASMIWEDSS